MKVFLPVLLAALLGVEQAHSLVCFSCVNKNSNWCCLKPTVRSDTDSYCVTISASAGIGNVVDFGYTLNEGCSRICPIPSVSVGVASVGSHCCQSFPCNISVPTAGCGPAPLCWASGSCSACCRLCCDLGSDRRDPVPGPDSQSSGRKESPAPPRRKRISKPPPLIPHLLSPPSRPWVPLGPPCPLHPHTCRLPLLPSQPSRGNLGMEPEGPGVRAASSGRAGRGTWSQACPCPGPVRPQVQKMCCVDRRVVRVPCWAWVSVWPGLGLCQGEGMGVSVRSPASAAPRAPSASTEPLSPGISAHHISLTSRAAFGKTALPLFPGLGC